MDQLSARDTQTLWLSAKIPSDQFLVFGFDPIDSIPEMLSQLMVRAHAVDGLAVRVDAPVGRLDHPYWVPTLIGPERFITHDAVADLDACYRSLATAMSKQVDPYRHPWRCHVWPVGSGAPTPSGAATVVVVQMSHAFADGRLATAFARRLLGGRDELPVSRAVDVARSRALLRGIGRFGRQSARLIAAVRDEQRCVRASPDGGGGGGVPVCRVNRATGAIPVAASRTVATADLRPGDVGVSAGALATISAALAGYLGADPATPLAAETTIARPGSREKPDLLYRNHFRNVGVDLHTEIGDLAERAGAIAAALRVAQVVRPRADAAARVAQSVPAPMLAAGVRAFDVQTRSPVVTGNTVVSSVNRGSADLVIGGAPVRFTAGFPALSPMQGLTHGVHGIGDTVTVSVLADPTVVDVPDYLTRLDAALEAMTVVAGRSHR